MILSDFELKMYLETRRIFIDPFDLEIIQENGVDLRLSDEIARLENCNTTFDLNEMNKEQIESFYKKETYPAGFVVNPGEKILFTTLEYIVLPHDLMAFCELRSTFARLGLSIPPTIVDAGFSGNLTIGLTGGSFPVRLIPKTRFLHLVFAKLSTPVEKPYRGKYKEQKGVTLPK